MNIRKDIESTFVDKDGAIVPFVLSVDEDETQENIDIKIEEMITFWNNLT